MSFMTGLDGINSGIDGFTGRVVASSPGLARAGAQRIVDTAKSIMPEDTGAMADSTKVTEVRKVGNTYSATAEVQEPYAEHVEFGTEYIDAEPFWRPAVHQEEQTFVSATAAGLQGKSSGGSD